MKLLRNYFLYNRLMRSLIKLPAVLLIWVIYTTLMYEANFPLFLYAALLFTVLYLAFTFNLEAGMKKFVNRGKDFHNYLTLYPLAGGIFRFLLGLTLAFFAMRSLQDHNSWQESFIIALHGWVPITILFIMHDVESWLVYRYGQL